MCGLHVGSGCGGEDRPTEPKLSRMILCGVASSVRSTGFAVRRCEFPSPGRARGGVGCGCAVMGSGNGLRRKRRNGRFLFSASRSCWAGKPSTLPCEEVLPGGSFGGGCRAVSLPEKMWPDIGALPNPSAGGGTDREGRHSGSFLRAACCCVPAGFSGS